MRMPVRLHFVAFFQLQSYTPLPSLRWLLWLHRSYDHVCKLWDARQRRCLLSVNHGAPIESVAFFPTGALQCVLQMQPVVPMVMDSLR